MDATNVGDEGGFAPNIQDNKEGLELLKEAIQKAGHTGKVQIGMDVAASEFYDEKSRLYNLNFKSCKKEEAQNLSGEELLSLYESFKQEFPIVSIEDPFDQDDWESYSKMTAKMGTDVQVVGDDLLVTNPKRVETSIQK